MTIKTIQYNTSDQNVFAHNTAEILIDGAGASLIRRSLNPSELFVATGRIQLEADISPSLPIYLSGNTSHTTVDGYDVGRPGYLSLNDDTNRDGANPLTPTSHFAIDAVGTIRFKTSFSYTQYPAQINAIFTTGNSVGNSFVSLVSLAHNLQGKLELTTYDAIGSNKTMELFGIFSPVAGQEYEFEFDYNETDTEASLWVDGVLLATVATANRVGVANRDYFYLGSDGTNEDSYNKFKDIQIFDTIQHTSSFASEIISKECGLRNSVNSLSLS